MGDFKKRGGSFGGGNRGGGFGGGRSGARPGNRDFRESQMFSATCAECQKTCEVPFRPSGDKPVYCSYCFSKHKEDGSDHPRRNDGHSERRDERPRGATNSFASRTPSFDRAPRPQVDNTLVADLKKQIENVNNKLDKVMELLKRGDSVEIRKAPEAKKVDVKALSVVVKKAIVAPAPKKAVVVAKVAVAKKSVKAVAKVVKKGKK
jgi:CxxC-x17-CxxC domain-containing protein